MIKPGIYKHYKGNLYEVLGLSLHSESRDPLVVYKALYEGDFPKNQLWVRPIADFCGTVYKENVGNVPRFVELAPHEIWEIEEKMEMNNNGPYMMPGYMVYDAYNTPLEETHNSCSFYAQESLRYSIWHSQPFYKRWFSKPKSWSHYANQGYTVRRVKIQAISEDDPFVYEFDIENYRKFNK